MASDDAEIIQLMRDERKSAGQYGVVKGMEGDKKKAADSIAIQTDTGRDSQRTYGNYDVESKKVKSELAQQIVEKDNRLLRYIEGDPLAATVSKDDWGNLGTFTDIATKLTVETSPILKAMRPFGQLCSLDRKRLETSQLQSSPRDMRLSRRICLISKVLAMLGPGEQRN
jgi:hypothetical protein